MKILKTHDKKKTECLLQHTLEIASVSRYAIK